MIEWPCNQSTYFCRFKQLSSVLFRLWSTLMHETYQLLKLCSVLVFDSFLYVQFVCWKVQLSCPLPIISMSISRK